jgi:hypothetical protein
MNDRIDFYRVLGLLHAKALKGNWENTDQLIIDQNISAVFTRLMDWLIRAVY